MKKVSIIVPCYNYGHFLSETLDTVLHQTYHNWECLIIDDGSTDNTKDIAHEYIVKDKRFIYIYQANKGLSAARNTGLLNAKGWYIQFLDADDLIAPQKLELQVGCLSNNSSFHITYGNVRYFDTNNKLEYKRGYDLSDVSWMPCISGKGLDILTSLMLNNIMVVSSPLIRRELIDKVGSFNVGISALEDWEFWVRCALVGSYFQYDNREEVLTFIRVHSSSMQKDEYRMLMAELKMRHQLHKHAFLPKKLNKINDALYISKKEKITYNLLQEGYLKKGLKEILDLIYLNKQNAFLYLKNYLYWVNFHLNFK